MLNIRIIFCLFIGIDRVSLNANNFADGILRQSTGFPKFFYTCREFFHVVTPFLD